MNHQRYLKPAMLVAAIVAILVAAGVPIAAFLPFLFLLACPLMMVFMMRGMDGGRGKHAGCHGEHGSAESHEHRDQQTGNSDSSPR